MGFRAGLASRLAAELMGGSVLICTAAILTPEGYVSNLGDEALTQSLLAAVRDTQPGTRVRATLHPRGNALNALPDDRIPVRPVWRLARAIREADIVVLGGGTLFQEDVSLRKFEPIGGLLRYLATVTFFARLFRKPVVVAAVGAEDLESRRSRGFARYVCRSAVAISSRDEASARLLRKLACGPVTVAADPMFLLPARDAVERSGQSSRLLVSLRPDASDALLMTLALVIRDHVNHGGSVCLVPMDRRLGHDLASLARLRDIADVTAESYGPEASWERLLAAFQPGDICVGMRLHFLIFAAIAGASPVALTTSMKTRAFVDDTGIAHCPAAEPALLERALEEAHPLEAAQLDGLRMRARRVLEPIRMALQ